MEFDDTYKTIAGPTEGLFKEKGSKFFAYAFPVHSEEQIKELLETKRKEHHGSKHVCYAYKLGMDDNRWRVNDAGEPSGTAGKPIYGQILSHGLTNLLVVVVRYFGGTKLGVGGLIAAYRNSAIEALAVAKVIEKQVRDELEILFEYPQMNAVMQLVKDEELEQLEQQFEESCRLLLSVPKSQVYKIVNLLKRLEDVQFNVQSRR